MKTDICRLIGAVQEVSLRLKLSVLREQKLVEELEHAKAKIEALEEAIFDLLEKNQELDRQIKAFKKRKVR